MLLSSALLCARKRDVCRYADLNAAVRCGCVLCLNSLLFPLLIFHILTTHLVSRAATKYIPLYLSLSYTEFKSFISCMCCLLIFLSMFYILFFLSSFFSRSLSLSCCYGLLISSVNCRKSQNFLTEETEHFEVSILELWEKNENERNERTSEWNKIIACFALLRVVLSYFVPFYIVRQTHMARACSSIRRRRWRWRWRRRRRRYWSIAHSFCVWIEVSKEQVHSLLERNNVAPFDKISKCICSLAWHILSHIRAQTTISHLTSLGR